MKTSLPTLLSALAATAAVVTALPEFIVRIPNGANVPGVLAVGHLDPYGSNKSMNAFGRDFNRKTRRYWNATLCVMDSDGDGQTNGQELGDPCCLWTNVSNPIPAFTVGVSDPGNNKSMVDPAILAKYLPCPANSPAVIYALPVPGANTTNTTASPAPGTNTTVPTPGTNTTRVPTPGTNTTVPVPGSNTTVPVPGSNTTVPAPGSNTTVPVPGTTTSAPAPGTVTTAPAPGTTTSAPAPGTTTTAPAPGTTTTAPAPGTTTRKPELCLPTPPKKDKTPKPTKTKKKWIKA